MRRIKLERVTGVVALSYLVLIPVGGVYVWRKVRDIDKDLTAVWDKIGMDTTKAPSVVSLEGVRRVLKRT